MNPNSQNDQSTIIERTEPGSHAAPFDPQNSPKQLLAENLFWAMLCLGAGWLGFQFADANWQVPSIYPHFGLAFAVLWHRGWNRIPGVLGGFLAIRIVMKAAPIVFFGLSVIDVCCLIVGVGLLRRLVPSRNPLDHWRDTMSLLACSLGVSAISGALLGSTFLWWVDGYFHDHWWDLLAIRWLALATGIGLFGFLGMAWWPWSMHWPSVREECEAATFGLGMIAVCGWVFARPISFTSIPIPDVALLLPVCVFGAVRFGIRGSTTTMLVIGLSALSAAWNDRGPFIHHGGIIVPSSLLLTSGNSLVASVSMLLAAVFLNERNTWNALVRKSDVRFQILFENFPDAVFVVDMNNDQLLAFNDELPAMLGYSRSELQQMTRQDFEVQSSSFSQDSSVMSSQKITSRDIDLQYRCHDGRVIDVNVTYSGIEFSGRSALLMMARDVTVRRRAESLLRESEHKFRTLAESIPVLVVIQSSSLPTYWNTAAATITGYSINELADLDFVAMLKSGYRAEVLSNLRDCARGTSTETRNRIVTLRRKNNEERLLDLSLTSITLDGRAACLITGIDVTDRRKAEREIRSLNSQLFHTARLRLLGEFVAGVAHDLRHPIGAIQFLSDALCRRMNDDSQPISTEELRDKCGRIHGQAERAISSLARLRDLAQRHETNREWIPLIPLIADASRLARLDEAWQTVSIVLISSPMQPIVFADRAELTQVLLDLIRNGLESMQDIPLQDRQIILSLIRYGAGTVRLSVTDRGCGVPEEFQKEFREETFKAFQTSKPKGMGMGLSLCQAVVKAHEGRLWFEPAKPHGSTFHLTLKADESTLSPDPTPTVGTSLDPILRTAIEIDRSRKEETPP